MPWLHRIMAGLFLLSAALQWNDPDPIRWMALYASAAGLAVLAAQGRAPRAALLALLLFCTGWMLTLLPGVAEFASRRDITLLAQSMKAERPWIEEAREFGGLGIVAVWALGTVILRRRANGSAGA